jgi:hypothetical protein
MLSLKSNDTIQNKRLMKLKKPEIILNGVFRKNCFLESVCHSGWVLFNHANILLSNYRDLLKQKFYFSISPHIIFISFCCFLIL